MSLQDYQSGELSSSSSSPRKSSSKLSSKKDPSSRKSTRRRERRREPEWVIDEGEAESPRYAFPTTAVPPPGAELAKAELQGAFILLMRWEMALQQDPGLLPALQQRFLKIRGLVGAIPPHSPDPLVRRILAVAASLSAPVPKSPSASSLSPYSSGSSGTSNASAFPSLSSSPSVSSPPSSSISSHSPTSSQLSASSSSSSSSSSTSRPSSVAGMLSRRSTRRTTTQQRPASSAVLVQSLRESLFATPPSSSSPYSSASVSQSQSHSSSTSSPASSSPAAAATVAASGSGPGEETHRQNLPWETELSKMAEREGLRANAEALAAATREACARMSVAVSAAMGNCDVVALAEARGWYGRALRFLQGHIEGLETSRRALLQGLMPELQAGESACSRDLDRLGMRKRAEAASAESIEEAVAVFCASRSLKGLENLLSQLAFQLRTAARQQDSEALAGVHGLLGLFTELLSAVLQQGRLEAVVGSLQGPLSSLLEAARLTLKSCEIELLSSGGSEMDGERPSVLDEELPPVPTASLQEIDRYLDLLLLRRRFATGLEAALVLAAVYRQALVKLTALRSQLAHSAAFPFSGVALPFSAEDVDQRLASAYIAFSSFVVSSLEDLVRLEASSLASLTASSTPQELPTAHLSYPDRDAGLGMGMGIGSSSSKIPVLEAQELASISDLLEASPPLLSFSLSHRSFPPGKGFEKQLAHALATLHPQVQSVSLAHNNLSPEGVSAFLSALPPSITSIRVASNGLSSAAAFARFFSTHPAVPSLTALDLSDNRLSDAAVFEILAGIPSTTSVARFDFSRNPLGHDPCMLESTIGDWLLKRTSVVHFAYPLPASSFISSERRDHYSSEIQRILRRNTVLQQALSCHPEQRQELALRGLLQAPVEMYYIPFIRFSLCPVIDLRDNVPAIPRIPKAFSNLATGCSVSSILMTLDHFAPLEHAIASSGRAAPIIAYCRGLQRGFSIDLPELNLFVLGGPSVGKSSLAAALLQHGASSPPSLRRHDQIAVSSCIYHGHYLHCWDFASAPERYSPPFLLAEASLFLIVFKLSDQVSYSAAQLAASLESLQAHLPAARPCHVALVGTHSDQLPATERQADKLQAVLDAVLRIAPAPKMLAVLGVSTLQPSDAFLSALRDFLLSSAPKLLSRVPAALVVARQAIDAEVLTLSRAGAPPLLSSDRLHQVVAEGLQAQSVGCSSDHLQAIVKALVKCGHVLRTGLGPSSLVVLEPHWVSWLISSLLTASSLFPSALHTVILQQRHILQLWRDPHRFPTRWHSEFASLLSQMEVLLPFPSPSPLVLFPLLLPLSKPSKLAPTSTPSPSLSPSPSPLSSPDISLPAIGHARQYVLSQPACPAALLHRVFLSMLQIDTAIRAWTRTSLSIVASGVHIFLCQPLPNAVSLVLRRPEEPLAIERCKQHLVRISTTIHNFLTDYHHVSYEVRLLCDGALAESADPPSCYCLLDDCRSALLSDDRQCSLTCSSGAHSHKLSVLACDQFLADPAPGLIIDRSLLVTVDKIGEGSFGQISLARLSSPDGSSAPRMVAVKCLELVTEASCNDFLRETSAMARIRHPNVVELVGVFLQPPAFVMELLEGSDLYHLLTDPLRLLRLRAISEHISSVLVLSDSSDSRSAQGVAPRSFEWAEHESHREAVACFGTWLQRLRSPALVETVEGLQRVYHATHAELCKGPRTLELFDSLAKLKTDIGTAVHSSLEELVPVEWPLRLKIACDIALGMHHLHHVLNPPIVHRDLKSPNVFLTRIPDSSYRPSAAPLAKIGDFGLVVDLPDQPPLKVCPEHPVMSAISATWVSPEVLSGAIYGTSADVYAMGLILWELVARSPPYQAQCQSEMKLLGFILDGGRPVFPASCDPDWAALASRCWVQNPSDRPTFTQIYAALHGIAARIAPDLLSFLPAPNSLSPKHHSAPASATPASTRISIAAPVRIVLQVPAKAGALSQPPQQTPKPQVASTKREQPEKKSGVFSLFKSRYPTSGNFVTCMTMGEAPLAFLGTREGRVFCVNTATNRTTACLTEETTLGHAVLAIAYLPVLEGHVWASSGTDLAVWRGLVEEPSRLRDSYRLCGWLDVSRFTEKGTEYRPAFTMLSKGALHFYEGEDCRTALQPSMELSTSARPALEAGTMLMGKGQFAPQLRDCSRRQGDWPALIFWHTVLCRLVGYSRRKAVISLARCPVNSPIVSMASTLETLWTLDRALQLVEYRTERDPSVAQLFPEPLKIARLRRLSFAHPPPFLITKQSPPSASSPPALISITGDSMLALAVGNELLLAAIPADAVVSQWAALDSGANPETSAVSSLRFDSQGASRRPRLFAGFCSGAVRVWKVSFRSQLSSALVATMSVVTSASLPPVMATLSMGDLTVVGFRSGSLCVFSESLQAVTSSFLLAATGQSESEALVRVTNLPITDMLSCSNKLWLSSCIEFPLAKPSKSQLPPSEEGKSKK